MNIASEANACESENAGTSANAKMVANVTRAIFVPSAPSLCPPTVSNLLIITPCNPFASASYRRKDAILAILINLMSKFNTDSMNAATSIASDDPSYELNATAYKKPCEFPYKANFLPSALR